VWSKSGFASSPVFVCRRSPRSAVSRSYSTHGHLRGCRQKTGRQLFLSRYEEVHLSAPTGTSALEVIARSPPPHTPPSNHGSEHRQVPVGDLGRWTMRPNSGMGGPSWCNGAGRCGLVRGIARDGSGEGKRRRNRGWRKVLCAIGGSAVMMSSVAPRVTPQRVGPSVRANSRFLRSSGRASQRTAETVQALFSPMSNAPAGWRTRARTQINPARIPPKWKQNGRDHAQYHPIVMPSGGVPRPPVPPRRPPWAAWPFL